jgi:hypothetical protein
MNVPLPLSANEGNIAITPLPAGIIAGTLAAAAAFVVIADLVKVPTFRHLGIA